MRSTPRHAEEAAKAQAAQTAQSPASNWAPGLGRQYAALSNGLTACEPLPQGTPSTIEGELAGLAEISTLLLNMASQIAERLGDPKPTGFEQRPGLGMSVVDRLRAFRNTLIDARGHLEAAFNTLG